MTASRVHVITGERELVRAALARAWSQGRVVSVADARTLPGGQVRVLAELRSSAPGRSGWERSRPWLVRLAKLAAVLAVLAVVVGLVWVSVLAVLELIALVAALVGWVQAHVVEIALSVAAVVALLIYVMAGGSRCGGMHCGGCRR